MSDKPLVISAKNINEKDYKEIKANEVLGFLNRYSKIQWEKGKRRTRQLFPSFDIISKNCKLDDQTTKVIIDLLEEKGEIIRDVSQRYIKWVWKKLQEQKQKLEDQKKQYITGVNSIHKSNNSNIQQIEKEEKKTLQFDMNWITKIKNIIFKILVLFPVITGIYLSIYFTKLWFDSFFDPFQALGISLFIVFSSLVSFEIFILIKKWIRYIFLFIWIIIISFSITTGINGQLNLGIDKKIKYQESNIEDKSKIQLFEHYNNKISDIKIDISNVREERNNLMLSLNKIDFIDNKKEYLNVNWLIKLKNIDLNKLKNELSELEKKKEELLKQNIKINVPEKIDFFDWLESIFKIEADIFKFILYLFLSVFADTIPPLFFSIVLFYKEEGK